MKMNIVGRISRKTVSGMFVVLLIVGMLSPCFVVHAALFSPGDTVQVINCTSVGLPLRVRASPSLAGTIIGYKNDGDPGMILTGPQSADGYNWWKVRWPDNLEGWSAEGDALDYYLTKVTIPPSTKFSIGDPVTVTGTGVYGLNVRNDPPSLSDTGTNFFDGQAGTVVGGPFYGIAISTYTPGFHYFWKINYGTITGWSAQEWLVEIPPSLPIVHLESKENDVSTFNLGTIALDWVPYSLPSDVRKASATYQATYNAVSAHVFDYWETSGSVSVSNPYNNPVSVTVSGSGTLRAVYAPPTGNNAPFAPFNPRPTNHQSGVAITHGLVWDGGDPDADDTVTYDVYLGLSSPPPLVASDWTGMYVPSSLSPATTYYWQIVSRDNHGWTTAGPVWDFTTETGSYDATITAHCSAEGVDVSVAITEDGSPTGYNTPHTFTGLTNTHTFAVPSTDANGHPFINWNTGQATISIPVTSGGIFTAYYQATPSANHPPNQPSNISPANGAPGVELRPTFRASAFYDPDPSDTHAFSRWQVTRAPGDYSNPVFDIVGDIYDGRLTQITFGIDLEPSTTYYWRVSYRDSGYPDPAWSIWSVETHFTTLGDPDFSVTAFPTSLTIQRGSSGTSTITVASANGFSQLVQLTVPDAPSGVTPSFSPPQVTPPSGNTAQSTLTLYVSPSAIINNYQLTVTGIGGSLTRIASLNLQVTGDGNRPPTLSGGGVAPSSGVTTTLFEYSVIYADPDGDAPTVSQVYIDGSPHAMTKVSGDYVSGATYRYSTNLAQGSYNYYFSFSDGHDHTARLPLSETYSGPNVSSTSTQGFAIVPSSTSLSVQQGSSASLTITVFSVNGFYQPIQLTVAGMPLGSTGTLSPSQVTPPAGKSAASTLTLSAASTTSTGSYTLIVKGTSGSLIGSTNINLRITAKPTSALPVIASPLIITPKKDTYFVGDSLAAGFTIKNIGGMPVTLDILTVGGRLNGLCPAEGPPDFSSRSVTLQPSGAYSYTGSLTLTRSGTYRFFIAYYINHPNPDEKRLLDENNWNTSVQLAQGLTGNDRVKNIIVYNGDSTPIEITALRNRIENLKTQNPQYPPNLLDPNSFDSAVAAVWTDFTSFVTKVDLSEEYYELYQTGVNYDYLRLTALLDAGRFLEGGDVEGAKKYLQRSHKYERLSAMSFCAAAEVFDGSLEAGEILAKGIRDGCESAVSLGVKILCPAAGAKVDAIYMAIDWAFEAKVEGVDQATKDFFVKIVIKAILKDVKFVSLDYDTLENYVNGVASKVPLEELLNNMEFMTEFESQLRTVMFDKVVNEGIKEAIENEEIREAIIKSVRDHLRSSVASLKANAKCPVELRVFGVSGETGLQSGEVRHDIPMSFYYNGTITLFSGTDCYCYQVQGIGLGSYNLEITLTGEGETTTFDALNISTSQGVLHQYTVNWSALSRNEKGVTIMVDSDGDRVFESALASGSELNSTQFAAGMHHATDINGDGKVDIVDLVALALAFRCRPADSKWNPAADFNCDQTIDILDIFRLAMDFGKTF